MLIWRSRSLAAAVNSICSVENWPALRRAAAKADRPMYCVMTTPCSQDRNISRYRLSGTDGSSCVGVYALNQRSAKRLIKGSFSPKRVAAEHHVRDHLERVGRTEVDIQDRGAQGGRNAASLVGRFDLGEALQLLAEVFDALDGVEAARDQMLKLDLQQDLIELAEYLLLRCEDLRQRRFDFREIADRGVEAEGAEDLRGDPCQRQPAVDLGKFGGLVFDESGDPL